MSYAKTTKVKAEKSRDDIERVLRKYGADSFMYGWQKKRAVVRFEMNSRRIQFSIAFPDRFEREFTHTETGKERTKTSSEKLYEQATRQRWRTLLLTIKAKLVSVEDGVEIFDEAFMAQIQLPNGATVGETMKPQIEQAYIDGKMPAMIPEFHSEG